MRRNWRRALALLIALVLTVPALALADEITPSELLPEISGEGIETEQPADDAALTEGVPADGAVSFGDDVSGEIDSAPAEESFLLGGGAGFGDDAASGEGEGDAKPATGGDAPVSREGQASGAGDAEPATVDAPASPEGQASGDPVDGSEPDDPSGEGEPQGEAELATANRAMLAVPNDATTYDLWVDGVQVTDANKGGYPGQQSRRHLRPGQQDADVLL